MGTLFQLEDDELENFLRDFATRHEGWRNHSLSDALQADPGYFPIELEGNNESISRDGERRDVYYDDDYNKYEDPFSGDHMMRYNIFWPWSVGGEWRPDTYVQSSYCDAFGDFVIEGFRRAGYLFWDHDRVNCEEFE